MSRLIRIAYPGAWYHVNEIVSAQTVVLELKVDKNDMGKVIGKQGRTANAIRAILNAASGGAGKRYVLEIID